MPIEVCPERLKGGRIERDERRLARRSLAGSKSVPQDRRGEDDEQRHQGGRSASVLHECYGNQSAIIPAITCGNRTTSTTITAETLNTISDE